MHQEMLADVQARDQHRVKLDNMMSREASQPIISIRESITNDQRFVSHSIGDEFSNIRLKYNKSQIDVKATNLEDL